MISGQDEFETISIPTKENADMKAMADFPIAVS